MNVSSNCLDSSGFHELCVPLAAGGSGVRNLFSFDWLLPVDPEQGATVSMGLPFVLLPEYHMYHRCSLSPK